MRTRAGVRERVQRLHLFVRAALWVGVCICGFVLAGCSSRNQREVVIYTSQDEVYAEAILRDFTRETGVKVKAVYDSEAVKTVGLANRVLAERSHPQCDVFWSNEELRTRQLAAEDVFAERDGWHAVGYRQRRLVINTNHLSEAMAPRSLLELTNAAWKGRIALAYPLFGTTATHFLALRQQWGEAGWLAWCRALQANRPFVVDGNSVVVKMVARGEAWIGLTDSDDIRSGIREGMSVRGIDFAETLIIPNTLGLIRNAPHPTEARQLIAYLSRREIVEKLMAADALEGVEPPKATGLTPDWKLLLRDLNAGTARLKEIFLRQG